MAFVLLRQPSVELVLRDEGARVSEHASGPVLCGGADAIYFIHCQTQKFAAQVLVEGCKLFAGAAHAMLPHEGREPSPVRLVQSQNGTCPLQGSSPGCKLTGSSGARSLLLLTKPGVPFSPRCTQCCLPSSQRRYVLAGRLPGHPPLTGVPKLKEECFESRLQEQHVLASSVVLSCRGAVFCRVRLACCAACFRLRRCLVQLGPPTHLPA